MTQCLDPRPQQLVERALPMDAPHPNAPKRGPRRPVRSVTVNINESPLGWLKARGLVSGRLFDAGEQLRADYERAALGPRVTMAWDAAPISRKGRASSDPHGMSAAHIAAKQRFDAALAAVGKGLSDILWRVVCAGENVPVAEKALAGPARSGRLVLGLALDRLADHYRMR